METSIYFKHNGIKKNPYIVLSVYLFLFSFCSETADMLTVCLEWTGWDCWHFGLNVSKDLLFIFLLDQRERVPVLRCMKPSYSTVWWTYCSMTANILEIYLIFILFISAHIWFVMQYLLLLMNRHRMKKKDTSCAWPMCYSIKYVR